MALANAPRVSFQSTDLQRRARDILDAARTPEGALIRDKDGTNFFLIEAARLTQDHATAQGLSDVLRLLRLVGLADNDRDPALYGEFGWLTSLPVDAQREFAWAYAHAVQSIPATGLSPVEQLIYDWQQTARAWSDPSLRAALTSTLTAPLADVTL